MLRGFSLQYGVAGLFESLLYIVLDISERNPSISKRHKEKKESEDLTESPITFLIALIILVALKRQLGVDDEEEVGGYEAKKANIEKCSMNSSVRRS